MSPTHRRIIPLILLIAVALAACGRGSGSPTPTGPAPEAVFTSAAQTAQAGLTAQAATLAAPTATPSPPPATDTPAGPSETPTPVFTPTETPVPNAGGVDRAEFVLDVTVPDGTTYTAGDTFTKTWRLKNVGTSTWTPGYSLVFVNGASMGGPASQPLGQNVAPNATVDLSVALTAPNVNGLQRGFWMLQNTSGQLFGIGPGFDLAFYVEINVTGATGTGDGGSGTPTATPSGGTGTGDAITGVTVTVDEASYTGTCPHTFTFTAAVVSARPARITLEIDAGASDPSYIFNLPGPQSFDVGTGTFNYTYTLTLTDSVEGWVQVRVTAPNVVTSNQATFSLECQ